MPHSYLLESLQSFFHICHTHIFFESLHTFILPCSYLLWFSGARFNGVVQVSAGPNFAPARAKGFNHGILALFSNRREADIVHSSDDHKAWHDKQLIPLVDGLIVVEFIPSRL
jgi:hypothetical protein